MPEAYEKWLVPTVFGPFAADLAARVAARTTARVLEVAAGTGVPTRELARVIPDAAVTATDLNDAMVALGRTQAPGATWRQADTMRLPFDDGSFDVMVCQFGVMFLPDKPAGYAEVRRVLTPGGTFLSTPISTTSRSSLSHAGLIVRYLEERGCQHRAATGRVKRRGSRAAIRDRHQGAVSVDPTTLNAPTGDPPPSTHPSGDLGSRGRRPRRGRRAAGATRPAPLPPRPRAGRRRR